MSPRAGQRSEQNHTQTAADREREQNDRKPRRRLLPSDAQLRLSGTHYRKLSSTVTLLLCLRIVERHSYSPGLSLFPLPSNTLHGPSTSEVTTYGAIQICFIMNDATKLIYAGTSLICWASETVRQSYSSVVDLMFKKGDLLALSA